MSVRVLANTGPVSACLHSVRALDQVVPKQSMLSVIFQIWSTMSHKSKLYLSPRLLVIHISVTEVHRSSARASHELHMVLNCTYLQDLYRLISSCITPEMASLPQPGLNDALDSNEQHQELLPDRQHSPLENGAQQAQSSQDYYGE